MKFKHINKNRIVENTVTNFWIKTSSIVIVTASVAYGTYIYFHSSNSVIAYFINFTNKYSDRIERKQIENRNKPLVLNAYQNYLKEKKNYNQELEEETRRRLLQIRSKNQPQSQDNPELKATQGKEVEIQQPRQPELPKPGVKQKILYFLSLGYIKHKQHQAQISKFLTPSQSDRSCSATLSNDVSSKLSFHKLDESVQIPKTQELKKHKSFNDSKADISKYFSKNDELKCPVCSHNLTKLEEPERDKHVNSCLDRKDYLSFEYKPVNKYRKKENEELEKVKPSAQTASTSDPNEMQKKLSESLLKDAVPNCPICGKVLHNFNIRQNHLKKCSQVFHIRTESLVELVRKQKEKIEQEISKGLIPTDVFIPKTKKQSEKKTKISNRVIKLELPKSKNEEQLQIAVALSNSINPAEDCPKKAEIKLFKSNKKNEKKGYSESVLLLVDDETRTNNLSNKFASLLEKQIKYENQPDVTQAYFVTTKFNAEKNYLWNMCSYFEESEKKFYVQAFLQTGRFIVGHQVFIEKTDQ
ncbi:Structure-specific endonuclease subunit SLX4, partial [Brachionus plicatilis]